MNYYMMTADGRRIGPVPAEELLNHGLSHETIVWRQDFNAWIPASQVPELMNLLNSVPPCPPEPPASHKSYQQQAPNPFSNSPYSQNNSFNSHGFNQPQNQSFGMNGKPDNYMVWAILSTILCCVPFGIVSIVYAGKVNGLWDQGQYVQAKDAADKAKMWAMIAAGGGVLAGLFGFILGIAGA